MRYGERLSAFREAMGISVSEAAKRTRLSEREYRDQESERYDVPAPHQVGLFVLLGMPLEEATRIVFDDDPIPLADFGDRIQELAALDSSDPFVSEGDDLIVLSERRDNGAVYEIEKDRIDTAEKVVRWVYHLSKKSWITRKHMRDLTRSRMNSLKIEEHPPR